MSDFFMAKSRLTGMVDEVDESEFIVKTTKQRPNYSSKYYNLRVEKKFTN